MQPYDPYQPPTPPTPPYFATPNQPPPARRSAIPKVIGILMIIFGGLGLIGGLVNLVSAFGGGMLAGGFGGGEMAGAMSSFMTFSKVAALLGLAIGGLELFAGVGLVTYKTKGIRLAKAYAIANIAITIVSLIVMFAVLKPAMDRYGMGGLVGASMVLGGIVSVAWPTVVLALVTRPSAKASCTDL